MVSVNFIKRHSKPSSPRKGTFYWVDLVEEHEIWFSPDGVADNMILLNKDTDLSSIFSLLGELSKRIDDGDSDIDDIQLRLSEVEKDYIRSEDLSGYARLEDIPEFDDSDFDLSNKIKTINGQSLLGSGDITIEGTGLSKEQIENINKIDEKLDKNDLIWQVI